MAEPGNLPAPRLRGTGVVLRDPLPWNDCIQLVQAAEDTGYDAVFVPEIAGREAFSQLAGFAGATERILLGTGVVTIWSRDPLTTAMAASTVHDISGGRLTLGIGAGLWPSSRRAAGPQRVRQSEEAHGPLAAVREYVETVRRALAGEQVGPTVPGGSGTSLGVIPEGPPPRIWLGALGDRMIALAGEIADGVLLNWCNPERVAAARKIIAEAARRTGRDPSDVTVAVYVRACLGVERSVALEALREMTAQYAAIPHYRRQFEQMGMGEEAAIATKGLESGQLAEVPESLVRAVAVIGGRNEALGRFDEYREAGADLVLNYPVASREPLSSILGTVLAAAPSPAIER